jgi:hypothetical protein
VRHALEVYCVHVIRELRGIRRIRGLDNNLRRHVPKREKRAGVLIWEKCELISGIARGRGGDGGWIALGGFLFALLAKAARKRGTQLMEPQITLIGADQTNPRSGHGPFGRSLR